MGKRKIEYNTSGVIYCTNKVIKKLATTAYVLTQSVMVGLKAYPVIAEDRGQVLRHQ